jgi:formate hydrogenlyase transcriptional activator
MTAEDAVVSSELEERLRFESMLADLSSGFVNLESAKVDNEIANAQRRVCECLDIDLAALWQLSPEEPGVLRMSHLYRPMGGPPIPDDFDAREYNPWALEQVLAGGVVALPSIDDAPAEAVTDRETWRYFNIKSVFLFPLSTGGGSVIGAVSFHVEGEERSLPDEIVNRLRLV